MPEAEVPPDVGASARGRGNVGRWETHVAAQQPDRRVEPQTESVAHLQAVPVFALDQDVPAVDEDDAVHPSMDWETRLLIQDQQAVAAKRQAIAAPQAEALLAISAHARRAAGAE